MQNKIQKKRYKKQMPQKDSLSLSKSENKGALANFW